MRQHAWRALQRGAPGPPAARSRRVTPAAPPGELSRAGLALQPIGRKEEILLAWDRASRLSRAGLELELMKILGEVAPISGNAGPAPAV